MDNKQLNMDKFLKILKVIKDYFFVIVIGFLLITIYFKNIKIDNLNKKLEDKPRIEYVYKNTTDTITVKVPKPYQVVKWKETKDTTYVPIDLTKEDSTKIAQAYKDLFEEFGTENSYNNIMKDDSTAFIQLNQKVQYNTLQSSELIFTDRTPVVYITNTKPVYTTSIVGGIEAGTAGVEFGAGLVTKRNNIVKVSYDPFNRTARGAAYFNIFNFKSK